MKIFLDRIDIDDENNAVATFEVGDDMVAFTADKMPKNFVRTLIPNAIVECEIIDGCIVNPVILHDETKQKEEAVRKRLHSLFKRK